MKTADVCIAYLAEVTPAKAASTQRHDHYYAQLLTDLDRPELYAARYEARTLGDEEGAASSTTGGADDGRPLT